MNRINSETSEEKDLTDITIKRRISSILKVPRTPLRDIGSGNELNQDCNIEKRQKNSRRVSFADTIRVFPPDPQITVELNHAETARDQDPFNENEEPEVVQCAITGMNTLLHAPIQTPSQQMECLDSNTGREWNKMDRTLIFSEQNEMDMTSGHTVMITHDTGICQETDEPRKIDFKSFSTELKSKKEVSQVNEFSFFSCPTKANETCLSQQKTNTENTKKINLDDFLKSLKTTKPFPTPTAGIVLSEAPERNMSSSKDNAYSCLQGENCNITAVLGELDNRKSSVTSILSNEKAIAPASEQLRYDEVTLSCRGESMDRITFNTERILQPSTSSLSVVNQQENLRSGHSVNYNMDNCRLKPSSYQLDVQQDPSMCINEITVSNIEDGGKKHVKITSRAASQDCTHGTSTIPVFTGSVASMPVLHSDKTTTFSSFYADMEISRNCTGLIWQENFKGMGNPVHGASEKQSNDVSRLMEGTSFREDYMDITKHQDSTNCYINSMRNSGIAAPNQEATYGNMGLLNPRINPVSWTSSLPERKENALLGSLPSEHSAVFSASQVAKSYGKQADSQFSTLCEDITQWACTTAVGSKINRKSGLSNNTVIPEDKTGVFGDNMEITKPETYAMENSLNTAVFQGMPQQEIRTVKKSDKTVVFALNEDNEMEITKSCTEPINYNMQQVLSLQPVDKTVYTYYNDMDETKPITSVINQSVGNAGGQTVEKQSNECCKRTLTLNKTAMFTFSEDMEITKSVACVIDKSFRNVADYPIVPEENTRTGKKRVTESTSDKTVVFSLSKDNEMELTRSLTVAVEGALHIPAEKTNMYLGNSNMTATKTTSFVPADKTLMFLHNNDMEITKPITHISNTSLEDTGFKSLDLEKKEIGKILSGSANEQTTVPLLHEDNEMEVTRSHTVALNHDILQQVKVATQGLFSEPADKTSMSVHNSNATITKSTAFVPADKTMMFMCNNDMEITKPISDSILKNSCCKSLPQKGKETRRITLPGSIKANTTVLALHDDEMEITKCQTVAVNHDIVSQCERIPQALFSQDNMDITRSHTVTKNTKDSLHRSVMKLGGNAEWELSSNEMVALAVAEDPEIVKRHRVAIDSQTDLHCPPASQIKHIFPLNETTAFTSYQTGTEVTNLPTNAIDNGNLEESEKREMLNKTIHQNLGSVFTSAFVGGMQDAEVIRNHTDTIYDPNNHIPDAEKQILDSFTNSRKKTSENTIGEKMDIRNYTIGIEFMDMNDKNESSLHSQAKSSSEFPTSVGAYENKLDTAKVDKGTPEKSIGSASVMLSIPLDIVQEQQNFLKIQANQLGSRTSKINNFAKETTTKVVANEENDFMFPVKMPDPDPKLTEETALDLNTEAMCTLVSESRSLKDDPLKLSQPTQDEYLAIETDALPIDDKVTNVYETLSCEWSSIAKNWQNNTEFPPINTFPSEEEPIVLPKLTVINHCPNLKDIGKKPELVLLSQEVGSSLGEELPKLIMKPDNPLCSREDVKKESSTVACKEWTHTCLSEDAPLSVPLTTICTDSCKIKKMPLSIFPPKLPNKRKSALSNVEDIGAKSEERTEIQDSDISLLVKRLSDKITQNLSPSYYIDEELLPACVEEMDSNESLSCESPEKLCDVMNEKGIVDNEGHPFEELKTSKRQKRAWDQEDEELQKEKKFKVDEGWNDAAELKQPLSSVMVAHNHAEIYEGKNVPEAIAPNLEKTQSSNSSSLDSVKADTDFIIQRNSEMETQLLMESICEPNLQEKLQEGTITVREFFTLLQVHALIQKPRQSQLPPKHAVTTPPTLEDEILSQYVYRPKLEAYDEDCQAFYKIIEELKLHAVDQDKLLVNVHKSLWEVMRTCSDEELKSFGVELNKQKSCFTKMSKVLAHRRKATLYTKLVQSAQSQWEKLQSRLAKVDELLKEMDRCIAALETETATLEASEPNVNDAIAEYEAKLRETERELENHRAQEEALQRDQLDLRDKKQQMVSGISRLQEDVKSCQELMEKYNFSEWVLKEWSDHQAVFTFLYDSIELTVGLEFPVDGTISSNKVCQKIVSLNFESLLDEAKALPSSKLVHRLIFQFIDSQMWQEKCSTVHHLSQMLHDISLVVSRCQLLGEEIEFLNRWGGKFYLLKTEVTDTKVKLLFSSSIALAKFEVELSLSASYPASPVAFTVQKCTGNICQEEISVVLSSVPVGPSYLKRMVNQISHNLLQCPSVINKQHRRAVL
ncbi:kinetochore scaffold 1 [Elgaria multicarinata webbii]|uniref:kinetochore scaffold 1 n=1 Tax=Elgaria multicarinata webbii TaxID=159646 RepID=UPI002FCCC865